MADGTYAYVQPEGGWCVNNAGVLVGGGRLALIDTVATERRARALRAAAASLSDLPPHLVINTHFHGDHTFGNGVVAGGDALIVAHEQTRVEMAGAGLGLAGLWPDVEWGAIEVTLPHLTYRDRLTLHLGERRVELIHPGPAHTTNDTVVWLPEERVLFAGDVLLPGCTPFVLMGSVAGSLRAIDHLRSLGPRTVVGGHGPVSGPGVLDETEEYFRWLLSVAQQGRDAGLTPLELAREAGPGPYEGWLDPERVVGNLHRAYSELRGEPEGARLDVIAVFAELVEFNGGRLPACYA
ncbi:MBL fold metallo-hydrolase [Streptomyces sp. NPDC057702]|uniref:MBL fold metallo-hydrolase n=1 Tax=unclassified Streptomyces TaxID=2593676 RepID=UPI0036807EE7